MSPNVMYQKNSRADTDQLLLQHAPLVKRIAYHLMGRLPSNIQVEDLIQSGMIGLLEAIKNYDSTQGASFETYAGIRIRGAMLDEVRNGDWTPRSVHRKLREVTEAIRRVENRKGSDAKDIEVAEELGITLEEYHIIINDAAGAKIFSLDVNDTEDGSYEINIKSPDHGPSHELEEDHFKRALSDAIKNLPERESLVMSLYYDEEMNLREIGNVLGVSESRVCQIHGEALMRLRARMSEWLKG